jgi:microcystin-dependent protein
MALKNGRTTTSLQTVVIGSVIPTGTVQSFAGVTVPDGWLLCDGSAVSRTTYSALFEVISTLHGEGDAVTTFHLPDYRGRFLRGRDAGAGRDPDTATRTAANAGGASLDSVGSVQADAAQKHKHVSGALAHASTGRGAYGVHNVGVVGSSYNNSLTARYSPYTGEPFTSTGGVPRTSTETRVQNANVNYIIKV